MAKTPSTIITCNANALKRAAEELLDGKAALSMNGILNAFARAIAGKNHDWGFIKNAPQHHFMQPGLIHPTDQAAEAVTDEPGAWVLLYDVPDDWMPRQPRLFASKQAALAALRDDKAFWTRSGYPVHQVIAQVAVEGQFTFSDADDDDGGEVDAFQIWLQRLEVEPDHPLAQSGPVTLPPPSDMMVYLDPFKPEFYASMAEASAHFEAMTDEMIERKELLPADDCVLTAKFRPQAWVNNYAQDVDAEGATEWVITPDEIDIHDEYHDYLRFSLNAPEWVRQWAGPFQFSIDAEVRD